MTVVSALTDSGDSANALSAYNIYLGNGFEIEYMGRFSPIMPGNLTNVPKQRLVNVHDTMKLRVTLVKWSQ